MAAGWIDVPICEAILTKDLKLLVAVDGSAPSMTGLTYVTELLLQKERGAFAQVLHVYDDAKDYLPVACRREPLRSAVDAQLTGSVSSKRYRLSWVRKDGMSAGAHICESIIELQADYVCIGFFGLKGEKPNQTTFSTNLYPVLSQGNSCSAVVIKDESASLLPLGRPTKFVVSVSLNKSSTKAFLDALRLSRPGDEIHVVYVKGFMERVDSDYTAEVRKKYTAFFSGLKDGREQVFSKFHDRLTEFCLIPKRQRETTAESVVRYADSIDADFIVVGANAADRVNRGKDPVGAVSMQICLEWTRNFIVANWIDASPRVYEASVRRASTPSCGTRPGSQQGGLLWPFGSVSGTRPGSLAGTRPASKASERPT